MSAPLTMVLLSFVDIENATSILETGTGPSFLLPHVVHRKKKESKYVCTDLSEGQLYFAKQRMDKMMHKHA